jgi:hypothetical protein
MTGGGGVSLDARVITEVVLEIVILIEAAYEGYCLCACSERPVGLNGGVGGGGEGTCMGAGGLLLELRSVTNAASGGAHEKWVRRL